MILEDIAKMHRLIYNRFERSSYEPPYDSINEKKYVDWAMSEPISIEQFVKRINYYKSISYTSE